MSLDKDLIIAKLKKELELKQIEVNQLHESLEKVNNFIEKLIEDTELGVKTAMNLHRKIFTKKMPKFSDIKFSSKYIVSSSDTSSYYDFLSIKDGESFGLLVSDTNGYGFSALAMAAISSFAERVLSFDPAKILNMLLNDIKDLSTSASLDDLSMFMLNFKRKDLTIEVSGKDMPGVFILRNSQELHVKVDYNNGFNNKKVKLYPGDKVIVINNGVLSSVNMDGKVFSKEIFKSLISSLSKMPIGDIVHNIGYEVNKHTSNKRSLLGGDVVIIGMEIEKRLLYVV